MTKLIEFINSLAGLFAAIAALVAGFSAMLKAFRKRKERRRSAMSKGKHIERAMWYFSFVLISLSVAIFVVRATTQEALPPNVVLTTAAWDAFNAKDYTRAIAKAQECINEFRGSADREQAELEKQKAPFPAKGKVTDAEKQTILARGLLNDIATCYFIVGRSAEYLARLDLAREAYSQATRYTHARTWDPRGWFWSPAEAAGDRLATLK